ncbi:uncharacterized protein LOC141880749 [Acropora palmata]|uniref:uncharacterized protein LOC141880749 n=1 Tax=Acropora palmata TaxID=6131 RepID=UPI003DA1449B
MDQIHKKVLSNKTVVIMQRITNPYVLSGYLSKVFTALDKEEIEAKYKQSGATVATQHLIHLLEKRGPRAFPEFIKVLNDNTVRYEDLAFELQNEERRLRGQSGCSEPYQEPSSPPPVGNCTVDTLLKDIPYIVHTKVEKMMNPDDLSNHNWKGLAGAMGMSADNVRQLEGEARGKMAGLFNRMMHTKKTVKDLLELLKHPDVQRLDVIEEIVHGCKLPEELLVPTESCENEIAGSNEPVSSVEECCKSTANFKTTQYPRQESGDDRDTDAGIPRKDEHAEGTKGCTRTKSRTGQ